MAYCTIDDILNQYEDDSLAQFSDDDDGASRNDDIINAAITRADAEIDATLNGYLTVPFTTVPDMIKYISVDLAYFFLYKRRFNAQAPEWLVDSVNEARGMLAKIAAGELVVDAEQQSSINKMLCNKDEDSRLFTKTKLDAYFEAPF